MARLKVTITTAGDEGFVVSWPTISGKRPAGIVAVRTRTQADDLKAGIEEGLSAASAIYLALMPRKKKRIHGPGKVATLGGHARAQSLTPERRSEIARTAALAKAQQRRDATAAPAVVNE